MASPISQVLGILLALPASWLLSPGILRPLGPLHGTCSSVNESSPTSLYAALTVADNSANSSSSSPWWTACILSTPSSALSNKALVLPPSAYLSVMLDVPYDNAINGNNVYRPPWPSLQNCVHITLKDGAYDHGPHKHNVHPSTYSPGYKFLCELLIGLVFNPQLRDWASMLRIAACVLSIMTLSSIVFMARLMLAMIVYAAVEYIKHAVFLFVRITTSTMAQQVAQRVIFAAWSPLTTVALASCRIILFAHNIVQYIAFIMITTYGAFVIIPLKVMTNHVNHRSKSAPYLYTSIMRHVIGKCAFETATLHGRPQRPFKRRSSIRARYLAMRIVVDDFSSAKTFLYVLNIMVLNGILHGALHANCRFHYRAAHAILHAPPLRYVENIALAASCRLHHHQSISYMSSTVRCISSMVPPALMLMCAAMLNVTTAGSSDDDKRGPPKFSGEKTTFVGWFMLMSAYIAWKLHASASIFEELRAPPPAPPAPVMGRMAPRPPDAPAPVLEADGITIANQADIVAAAWAMASWSASPIEIINADEIKLAQDAAINFLEDNIRLYGLIVQSLPTWLVTSVYNAHRNDGLGTVKYLRAAFDARGGDSGDHAAQLAKLQLRYIDGRNTLNTDDVRKQFDAMMTAVSAIERTGNPRPNDLTLIAMYESSLPQAYSQIRQLTRRAGHISFLNYHMDVMSQVSAELTASAPAVHAFQGIGRRVGGISNPQPPGGSGSNANPCVQCGTTGHMRPNCTSNPVKCTGCGAPNHLEVFCTKGSGTRRNELTPNGQKLVDRDVKSPKKGRPPHATTPSYAAAAAGSPPATHPALPVTSLPPVVLQSDPTALALAHAAAVHAAQGHADPLSAINAYAGAMRALGHGFLRYE